jgi:aspartate 1-decarboxylase
VGDLLIICTYAPMSDAEVASYKPKVVLLDERNAIKEIRKFD